MSMRRIRRLPHVPPPHIGYPKFNGENMATKRIKARVLCAIALGDVNLKANDVVAVDEKTLKAHQAELDPAPEAVQAALVSGGEEVQLDAVAESDPPAD